MHKIKVGSGTAGAGPWRLTMITGGRVRGTLSGMTHEQLLRDFYAAFARLDGETMAACYAPGATFDDPAFPGLRDGEPGDMWRMLTARATDLQVELQDVRADGDTGTARWVATYSFGQTGRRVVNPVRSTFRFEDGLIAEQRDNFAFHAWAAQALGLPGRLLGWAPPFRRAAQAKARRGLEAFRAGRGG